MDIQQADLPGQENLGAKQRSELLENADFTAVTDTPQGRRFIWRLLAECGVHRGSFCGEDSHRAAFLEGRRSVGLWLMALYDRHDERYLQLLREGRKDDGDDE